MNWLQYLTRGLNLLLLEEARIHHFVLGQDVKRTIEWYFQERVTNLIAVFLVLALMQITMK